MQLSSFPFQTLDWSSIPREEHRGETGLAYWQVFRMGEIRVRKVEYSAGYKADHWCKKGHIVYCIEGAFISELENAETFTLSKGMSYVVSDNLSSHRSTTKYGVKLLIIDGAFLNGG